MQAAAPNAGEELVQDREIQRAVERETGRLRRFLRGRVADPEEVEDILQDVFYEFVLAYRLLRPVEQAGAWLMRVARNRVIDRFRKKKPELWSDIAPVNTEDESLTLEEWLPSPEDGPEAIYARGVLLAEIEHALEELPEEQRRVFVAHEVEGMTFEEMARQWGIGINTLLSRKRYAVRRLRERLAEVYRQYFEE